MIKWSSRSAVNALIISFTFAFQDDTFLIALSYEELLVEFEYDILLHLEDTIYLYIHDIAYRHAQMPYRTAQ